MLNYGIKTVVYAQNSNIFAFSPIYRESNSYLYIVGTITHDCGDGMRLGSWIIICCCFALPVFAGVPQVVHPEQGVPVSFENADDIVVHVDRGPLGKLNNDQAIALVQAMVTQWNASPGSRAHMRIAAQLDHDVTADNVLEYIDGSICTDEHPATSASMRRGESPIIFDTDGSIIDLLSGQGASETIAGKAAYRCYRGTLQNPLAATQSFMVINGRFFDGVDEPRDLPANVFAGIILHELGHFLGLHHTVVNADIFGEMLRGARTMNDSRFIPVMYPLVLRSGLANTVLKPDDQAVLRWMYAHADVDAQQHSLHGSVFDADGFGVRGAVVTARREDDPRCYAVSAISGRQCAPLYDEHGALSFLGEHCAGSETEQGAYHIYGLEEGSYSIDVTEVPTTGGMQHNVFPKQLDTRLPGMPRYYHSGATALERDEAEYIPLARESLEALDIVLPLRTDNNDNAHLVVASSESTSCGFDRVDYETFLAALEDKVSHAGGLASAENVSPTVVTAGAGCILLSENSAHAPSHFVLFFCMSGMLVCGALHRIRRSRDACLLLCVSVAVATQGIAPVYASTAIPLATDSLATQAHTVFYGTCLQEERYTDERGMLVHERVYDVQRAVKGSARAGKTFRFVMPAMVASPTQCRVGHADVIFLHDESAWGYASPVGGSQGQLEVVDDARGRSHVVVPTTMQHVHSEKTLGASPTGTISPHAFLDEVQHIIEQQAP